MRLFLDAVTIEPVDERLAASAGLALAEVTAATTIDALVMASAARAAGIVYTSDPDDMTALQAHFRDVRVFSV